MASALLTAALAVLANMPALLRDRGVLAVSLSGVLVGVAFGTFWNALTFELEAEHGAGPAVVGLFGLVAAARALTSPPAGRLADRIGGRSTLAIVLAIAVAGWAALALGHRELGWLVVGTVLLDVGVWSNQVVNQTMLFARDGALHSRLNTLYFSTRFLGIAAGSTLGVVIWSAYGWPQVGLVAVTCLVVAAPIACSRAVSR